MRWSTTSATTLTSTARHKSPRRTPISRRILKSKRRTLFFFSQAEAGIRDYRVTGVQTCALPIYPQPVQTGSRALDEFFVLEERRGAIAVVQHHAVRGFRAPPFDQLPDAARVVDHFHWVEDRKSVV